MKRNDKIIRNQISLLNQAVAAKVTRREALKMGLVTGAAGILTTGIPAAAQVVPVVASPPTTPWAEPLCIPPVLQDNGQSGYIASKHQYGARFTPQRRYALYAKEKPWSFHPDLGDPSPVWACFGDDSVPVSYPGPTVDMRYGQPVFLRIYNNLPALATYSGYGIPQLNQHLHNFHTATESDGGPWQWYNPGQYHDHHYCMMRAGFSVPNTIPSAYRDQWGGDKRESLNTCFLHNHRPEFTAANVYKGLIQFFRVFDESDTGNETTGWRLPSGQYDVPLLIADKQFDPDTGELIFDPFNTDGFLGDKITVNGKCQPYFEVKRRKYRFRILNGGPSRFVSIVLRYNGFSKPFQKICDNGNFLEAPVTVTSHELWVAERHDFVIDFSQFPDGADLTLCNILPQINGRGPERNHFLQPALVENQLLQFRVRGPAVTDPSRVPTSFRPFPTVNLNEVVKTRNWEFERAGGSWAINGQHFDAARDHTLGERTNPKTQIKRNTAEKWVLSNKDDGWEHPVHIHFEEGYVLSSNGRAPPVRTRQDVYRVGRRNKTEVFLRFRDFPDPQFSATRTKGDAGRYPMHCHNMVHEDHAMMTTWNIVP